MNTTKKGNAFEERSRQIIIDKITSGELGLLESSCKVFCKKGYYSKDREKDIVFDLTIEVWPPTATQYILLFIIECKSYSNNVPVNDLEEFYAKIGQVTGANIKGIFITDSNFQEGALKFAKSKGIMLIKVNYDNSHNVIFYKLNNPTIQDKNEKESWEEVIERLITESFLKHEKIFGLKKLSAQYIESLTKTILNEFDPNILNYFLPININNLTSYIKAKYQLVVDYEKELGIDKNGNEIAGAFSLKEKKIFINQGLAEERIPFIFGHELGHYFLHSKLKTSQKAYDSFSDSEYNFSTGKYQLSNDKNWMEWQANQFAASIIIPRTSLYVRVYQFQTNNGIRNKGSIYLDNQEINIRDFNNIITFLSGYFKVTKKSIIYRLEQTKILKYAPNSPVHFSNINFWE